MCRKKEPKYCLECGKKLSSQRPKRCKSCAAKIRPTSFPIGVVSGIPFKKGRIAPSGENHPYWKGGHKISKQRGEAKRKSFGFIPLNDWFAGSEGHHIDKEFVLYIPSEMHKSIWHSVIKGTNMEKINEMAINFAYGEEL